MSNQNKNALHAIGGNKNKTTFGQKAFRTGVVALTLATGAVLAKDYGHDLVPKEGNAAAAAAAVDTGNNTVSTTGLNEALIASRYNQEKGQIIKVTWGSDTLSNFATNLIKVTPSEGKPTAEKVLAAQNEGEIVTNTVDNDGAIEYGQSVDMKVPLDTNIAMLQQEEQPNGTKIEVIQ